MYNKLKGQPASAHVPSPYEQLVCSIEGTYTKVEPTNVPRNKHLYIVYVGISIGSILSCKGCESNLCKHPTMLQ